LTDGSAEQMEQIEKIRKVLTLYANGALLQMLEEKIKFIYSQYIDPLT